MKIAEVRAKKKIVTENTARLEPAEPAGGFPIHDMMMRYNVFVPRLYNWCISLGFTPGKVMPSRAFCSDESQG